MYKKKLQFLTTALLTFSMIQAIALSFSDQQLNLAILQDRQAYAKSSGARSGGGSFKSSPSSSSSSSSSSTKSPSKFKSSPSSSSSSSRSFTKSPSKSTPTSRSSPSSDRNSLTSPSQTQKNPAIVPVPLTSPSQTQKNPAIVPVPVPATVPAPSIIDNSSSSLRSSDANKGSSVMSWLVWPIILLIGGVFIFR